MKLRLHKKELKKSLLSLSVVSVILLIYFYIIRGQLLLGESLFLAGVLFFSIALWRIVRLLGLFDLTFYSFKKWTKHVDTDFQQYLQDNPYTEHFEELLIVSLVFMLVSIPL